MNNDDYQILTASWIMASNDENNLMTYKSIGKRLDITDIEHIKKLIKSRGELFRLGATKAAIDEWKSQMVEELQRPSWMRELSEAEFAKEKLRLSKDDIFRSQFRTERNAKKSDVNIIDWGLRHLERLYTNESSQTKTKIQIWTLIIAALGAVLGIVNILILLFEH